MSKAAEKWNSWRLRVGYCFSNMEIISKMVLSCFGGLVRRGFKREEDVEN